MLARTTCRRFSVRVGGNAHVVPNALHAAEAAAKFYVSVFKNSKVKGMTRYTGEEPLGKKGSVMTVDFELDGQEYVALNGPRFKFTEAVSFVVNCETQEEVDYYWEKLSADGGEKVQCGWLRDKYGLS